MAIAPTGAIFKDLRFDGTSLGTGGVLTSTYGIYITGEAVYNAPTRDVNMITIPGRNGLFAQDNGRFDNITVTYPAGLFGATEADFRAGIEALRDQFCSRVGYRRLEDGYNPNEFRMAVYKSGLEVDPVQLKAGSFNLTFECMPQRWLKSGESFQVMTLYQYLDNPTTYAAHPVLSVQGYGTVKIKQGDNVTKTVTVSYLSGESRTVYIDCETGFAYYQNPGGKENAGSRVTLPTELPVLTTTGHNQITQLDGTITQFAIMPRWWRV